MPNSTINGFTAILGADTDGDSDALALYDASAGTTKKISPRELHAGSLWPTTLSVTSNITLTGTLTVSSTLTANTFASSGATLTGGTINNMVIGGSTAAAGTFTSLTVSTGNLTVSTSGQGVAFATSSLLQEAANTLAQRNGLNAQAFRIYNTFTDAANYERFSISTSGSDVLIRKESAGTGSTGGIFSLRSNIDGPLRFGLGGTDFWQLSQLTGGLEVLVDNTRDLGAPGANRPRTGYFGTSVGVIGTVSGTGVLAVGNGTPPTAQADTVGLYSSDNSAGHTIPSFFCEGTEVLATGQADSASSVRVRMRINGTVVTLLAI